MEEKITVEEEKLITILRAKNYEKDSKIGIALISRKFNITDKVIEWLEKNPNAESEDVYDAMDEMRNSNRQ